MVSPKLYVTVFTLSAAAGTMCTMTVNDEYFRRSIGADQVLVAVSSVAVAITVS